MSEKTGISWTDHTFNPWWGCVKVSPACANCYAERDSKRYGFKVWGPEAERRFFSDDHWKEPLRWNKAAQAAGERRRVFCASMADVFEVPFSNVHDTAPLRAQLDQARMRLFLLIEKTPWLDWLLLTKRPGYVEGHVPAWWRSAFPENVWVGTTAETQGWLEERIEPLLGIPARVRFLSIEPMLGPMNLRRVRLNGELAEIYVDALSGCHEGPALAAPLPVRKRGLQWIIAGGESGPGARPTHPEWIRALRDQCSILTPFHFKQWGVWLPGHQYTGALAQKDTGDQISRYDCRDWDGDKSEQADELEEMSGHEVYRVGKKAAGRLLDGLEHNGFPQVQR